METKSSKDGHAYKMVDKSKEAAEDYSQKINEAVNSGTKAAEKGMKDANDSMMGIYQKQLQLMAEFYNQIISPMSNHTNRNTDQASGNSSFNNDAMRMFFNPFNAMTSNFSNPFFSSFDSMFKQMMDGPNHLFSMFRGSSQVNGVDWSALSKKTQEMMENRLEVSKNIFSALNEAHNKKVNFAMETNKKEMEEIHNQLSSLIKQNQVFFTDLMEICHNPVNPKDANTKDSLTDKKKFNAHIN